jgi:imidazoleglycerol-phosphate dehydratase
MRTSQISRRTAETDITLRIDLDGSGKSDIHSGVGFLDHMLTLFARHGRFDLNLLCKGDTQVDDHHSVEDIGICMGQAFRMALGDKKGITRYGSMILPMDEALVLTAADISGRSFLVWDVELPAQKVGTFDTELAEEFFIAFAANAGITLHIRMLSGKNTHHILEAVFKSAARSLCTAVHIDPDSDGEVPSTKGVL